MSLDISSIRYLNPDNSDASAGISNSTVQYDANDGRPIGFTANVPDNTPLIIKYRVNIDQKKIQETAGNTISLSNVAHMLSFDSKTDDENTVPSTYGKESYGGIQIVKMDYDNQTKVLPGAVFDLYDGDTGKHVTATKGGVTKNVTITTNSEGVGIVMGRQLDDGYSLLPHHNYYLIETKAPEGYRLDSTPINF